MATQTDRQYQAMHLVGMGRSGPTRQNQRDQGPAGVSGGEARHPKRPSRPSNKTPRPNNLRLSDQKPQTPRQGHPINSTMQKQRDQERHRDQGKTNPRHPANLTAPRDPPRYVFLCLCAWCGFAHQSHRDQGKATQSIQQTKHTETKIGQGKATQSIQPTTNTETKVGQETKAKQTLATQPN